MLKTDPAQLQRALYYWKPVIELIAFLTLVVQLVPVVFGCYIWFFHDGTVESDLGETTMMQSLTALLPYGCSLVVFYISMNYLKSDLNMVFGTNPYNQSNQPIVGSSRKEKIKPMSNEDFNLNTLKITHL